MIIYGGNDYRDYLAHYGIKGMKWKNHQYAGIVNGEYVYNNIATGMTGRSKAFDSEANKIKTMILSKGKFKKDKKTKRTDDLNRLLKELPEEKKESSGDYEKDLEKIANDTIRGKYGSGDERRAALEKMGLSYNVVQNKVNELLGSSTRHKVSADDEKKTKAYFGKSDKPSKIKTYSISGGGGSEAPKEAKRKKKRSNLTVERFSL